MLVETDFAFDGAPDTFRFTEIGSPSGTEPALLGRRMAVMETNTATNKPIAIGINLFLFSIVFGFEFT
jgi:hypothetical protein